jgi:hypothetical protein
MNIITLKTSCLVPSRTALNEEKVVSYNLYVMLIHHGAAIRATRLSVFGLNGISLCYKQLDTGDIQFF